MNDDQNDIDETDDTNPELPKVKNMSERSHEIGRDGAYLEVDADKLVAAFRGGELQKAKIIVIRVARIDMPDALSIGHLTNVVKTMVESIVDAKPDSDIYGMSDEQLSLYLIRECLLSGLIANEGVEKQP